MFEGLDAPAWFTLVFLAIVFVGAFLGSYVAARTTAKLTTEGVRYPREEEEVRKRERAEGRKRTHEVRKRVNRIEVEVGMYLRKNGNDKGSEDDAK